MTRLMRKFLSLASVLMAAWLATPAARAQEGFDLRLFRPSVGVWFGGSPDVDFTPDPDSPPVEGQYGARSIGFGANFPLGLTGVHLDNEHLLAHQVLLGVTFATTDQTIDPLARAPRLYNGGITTTALFATKAGNLYAGSLGASFAEDEDTIDDLKTRLFALGLGTWRKSRTLAFVYGGAVTYLFGRESVLPAFGVLWNPSPNWFISGALPFSVRVSQHVSEKVRFNYLLYAAGQRYRFANDGTFPGQDEVVFQRMRETHLGAEIEYRPSHDWAILGQAGIAGGRRLSFADQGEEDFFDSKIDPAPYVKVGVRCLFGKTVLEDLGDQFMEKFGGKP
ncbi:MAG TPA: DUF6268 family outer membrane beta-barrel protein [Dongiaceae bacterium]|nr:DUF6268 family outer membrane beta-barrel protein [Dongiaceae bacterium]